MGFSEHYCLILRDLESIEVHVSCRAKGVQRVGIGQGDRRCGIVRVIGFQNILVLAKGKVRP